MACGLEGCHVHGVSFGGLELRVAVAPPLGPAPADGTLYVLDAEPF